MIGIYCYYESISLSLYEILAWLCSRLCIEKVIFVLQCSTSMKFYLHTVSFQAIGRVHYSIHFFYFYAKILFMPEGALGVVYILSNIYLHSINYQLSTLNILMSLNMNLLVLSLRLRCLIFKLIQSKAVSLIISDLQKQKKYCLS